MSTERDRPRRILVFGAHPDDCDSSTGGTAALWVRAGHQVRFVSLTNGSTGHHEIGGMELARRRAAEARPPARCSASSTWCRTRTADSSKRRSSGAGR